MCLDLFQNTSSHSCLSFFSLLQFWQNLEEGTGKRCESSEVQSNTWSLTRLALEGKSKKFVIACSWPGPRMFLPTGVAPSSVYHVTSKRALASTFPASRTAQVISQSTSGPVRIGLLIAGKVPWKRTQAKCLKSLTASMCLGKDSKVSVQSLWSPRCAFESRTDKAFKV